MSVKSAINQITKSVIDVILLNCFMLLDNILRPKTNNTKNGTPIKVNRESDNNHLGNVAS